jgi:hypothetical protein
VAITLPCGSEVEQWIDLREGDILETLKEPEGLPEQVDLLLLDSVGSARGVQTIA